MNLSAMFKNTFLIIKTNPFTINCDFSDIIICHTVSIASCLISDGFKYLLLH